MRRLARLADPLWVGLLLLPLAGCGPTGPVRLAVTGNVTFGGKPLDSGTIGFYPRQLDGAFLGEATIVNGRYSIPASDGLRPGDYLVQVSSPIPNSTAPNDGTPGSVKLAQDRIPTRYNTKSKLAATVTLAGPNRFNYDLEAN